MDRLFTRIATRISVIAGQPLTFLLAVGIAALVQAGVGIADFSSGQPTLDEVFLALTGHHTEADLAPETEEVA